jgi:hypothetical protein
MIGDRAIACNGPSFKYFEVSIEDPTRAARFSRSGASEEM